MQVVYEEHVYVQVEYEEYVYVKVVYEEEHVYVQVRVGWLWEAADAKEWKEYMDSILAGKEVRLHLTTGQI